MSRMYEFSGTLLVPSKEHAQKAIEVLEIDHDSIEEGDPIQLKWFRDATTLGGGRSPEDAHEEMRKELEEALGVGSLEGKFETSWWFMENEPDEVCGGIEE
jgi:hypothetical protein